MTAHDGQPLDKPRVAVFGAGKMAMHHIRAIGMLPGVTLVAVADPVVAGHSQDAIAGLGGGVRLFASPEALMTEMRPQIVHICTPPDTHVDLARLALRHGAHIYIEKPFVLHKAEAHEIIAMAAANGCQVWAGHQLLFEAPTLRAEAQLSKIGRVVHIESYFSFRPVRYSRDGRPNARPLDQLIDILPHPVCLLLHFMWKQANEEMAGRAVELQAVDVGNARSVYAILRRGDVIGCLYVTLEGRPVESYVKVIGTNGYIEADYVRGTITAIPGPGVSAIAKIMQPYRQSWQLFAGTTAALTKRLLRKQRSYPGLLENIESFYGRIRHGIADVQVAASIVDTVAICEEIGNRLHRSFAEEELARQAELAEMAAVLPPADPERGWILVTGGTGFLGKSVAAELRKHGLATRVLARRMPAAADRLPGVEYVLADLACAIPAHVLERVSLVIHCAAETAGGKEAHERNSVLATKNLMQAMESAGIRQFVHVGSIACLGPGTGPDGRISEMTPLDRESDKRGPYVWGKTESERVAKEVGAGLGIDVKIVRPGPLVDYENFEPPGRLGKELGPWFVAIGSRGSRISLCAVSTAATVLRGYAIEFGEMPAVLNLVDPLASTRGELVARLLRSRPDLKVLWVPFFVIRAASPVFKGLQRLLWPGKQPVDIYRAFAAESYDCDLASKVIDRVQQSAEVRGGAA